LRAPIIAVPVGSWRESHAGPAGALYYQPGKAKT